MAYIQIPAFSKTTNLNNDDEFVIVVDGVEYLVSFKTLSEKFGNSPEILQEINAEIEALRNIVDAFPSENPAAPIALKISDTPTIDGIYKPTETGVYPNAGGLEYDPTEGITYFIRTQGVWTKDVTPINFTPTGVVEEGNTQAVSGGTVYDATHNLSEANLSDSYNYRGVLTVNPNTLLKTGLYILTSASPNIPKATTILIEVNVYGTRITQQARTLSIASESWVRGGDISNIENLNWGIDIAPLSITNNLIANETITSNKIAPKSINNSNLASDYDYRGFIFGSDNDANDILESGLYYVASSVLNLPKRNYFGGEAVTVIMEVQRYNTRIVQIARPANFPNEIYYRYTDSTFVGKPWIWTKRENGKLNGKYVALMGDSLTAQGKQHLYIWENTGAEVNRIAIGGTTMSNHGNSVDYTKLSFYKLSEAIASGDFSEQETAVENIKIASGGATDLTSWLDNVRNINWNNVDYIRVQYGTNDNAFNTPIGDVSRDNLDTSTYIGAFNYGVKNILEAYPHIRICVGTPLWRFSPNIGAGGDSDTTPNNIGKYLIDYVNALSEASKFNHLPFRNYYVSSGINKYTNTYYLSDGTHPNDNGSIVLGRLDSDLMSNN